MYPQMVFHTAVICIIPRIHDRYSFCPAEFGNEREQSLLWLNRNRIKKYEELPKTNARLEALKEKAFIGGAEKYLWIPPSMPYYEMQGAYKNSKGFSKILVFSAWEMVPRMIGAMAMLLPFERKMHIAGDPNTIFTNVSRRSSGFLPR